MADPPPHLTPQVCTQLRTAFTAAGYDAGGVADVLGRDAHAALGRDEPEPAARACRDAGPLGTLIELFLLGEPQSAAAVAAALRPLPVADAVAATVVREVDSGLVAGLDIRPHADDRGSWWIVADREPEDGSGVAADHVLGVGHASLSLVRATGRRPVGSVLDVGTGNGVQVLHASRHADTLTATDVSPRALALAEATFRLNGLDVELLRGEWFTPVADRRFDRIVCNPPFVVGPPRVELTYRDSGLAGDDASALVVNAVPGHLNPGGTGHVLASWLHRPGQDWTERVSQWVPTGTDAWIVQRDVADPALYVGTWLRDAGIDPRSPQGRQLSARWLDWFAANDVEGIGFGFVTLRTIGDGAPTVVCEDLRQAYDDPLGDEADGWLDRIAWLRSHPDLTNEHFVVADSVVLERLADPTEDGWRTSTLRLHRTDGPGWRHDTDEHIVALLAGAQGALPLVDLLQLLAMAHDVEVDTLVTAALPTVTELVRHGMLLPTELA